MWAPCQMTSCRHLYLIQPLVTLQAAFPALNPVGSVRDNLHRHSMQQVRDLGAAAEFFPSAREVGAVPHLMSTQCGTCKSWGHGASALPSSTWRGPFAAQLANAHVAQHVWNLCGQRRPSTLEGAL